MEARRWSCASPIHRIEYAAHEDVGRGPPAAAEGAPDSTKGADPVKVRALHIAEKRLGLFDQARRLFSVRRGAALPILIRDPT